MQKRHFVQINNHPSSNHHRPQFRRYIPHRSCQPKDWHPHQQMVQPLHAYVDLDAYSPTFWHPDFYCVHYPAAELFGVNWCSLRSYPYSYLQSEKEYTLHPNVKGKKGINIKCHFDGIHKASESIMPSWEEQEVKIPNTVKRYVNLIDKRNGIPCASSGDHSYHVAEYSPNFHKVGSTQPLPDFSYTRSKHDTFIPLLKKRYQFRDTGDFRKTEELQDSIKAVIDLENWRPATPLMAINST